MYGQDVPEGLALVSTLGNRTKFTPSLETSTYASLAKTELTPFKSNALPKTTKSAPVPSEISVAKPRVIDPGAVPAVMSAVDKSPRETTSNASAEGGPSATLEFIHS